MDYEKAYRNALEKARELYNDEQTRVGMTPIHLTEIFPELKESGDERIRKALIRFHKSTIDVDGIKGEDILAWLEKQKGEKEEDARYECDNIITRDDEILQAISVGLTDIKEDLGWSDFGGLPIEEIQKWLEKQKGETLSGWWVARDKSRANYLYNVKPYRGTDKWYAKGDGTMYTFPQELFPDLKWEDEPIEVDVTIKPKTT